MTGYETKTLQQLFSNYQFENDRINQDDAKCTKRLIVNELYRRMKVSLDKLENASTPADAKQIFKQFIEY